MTKSLGILMLDNKQIDHNVSQSVINSVYFGESKPVPIEEMWPTLVANESFKALRADGIPTCKVATDVNGEYFIMDSKESAHFNGIRWDVNKNISFEWLTNFLSGDLDNRYLSSSSNTLSYKISVKGHHLGIMKEAGCDRNYNLVDSYDKVKIGNPATPDEKHCVKMYNKWYYNVCLKDKTEVYVSNDTCDFVTWDIYTGFVFRGQLYFFGPSNVYIVSEKVYTQSTTSTIDTVPYTQFIKCSNNPHPDRSWDNNSKYSLLYYFAHSYQIT